MTGDLSAIICKQAQHRTGSFWSDCDCDPVDPVVELFDLVCVIGYLLAVKFDGIVYNLNDVIHAEVFNFVGVKNYLHLTSLPTLV